MRGPAGRSVALRVVARWGATWTRSGEVTRSLGHDCECTGGPAGRSVRCRRKGPLTTLEAGWVRERPVSCSLDANWPLGRDVGENTAWVQVRGPVGRSLDAGWVHKRSVGRSLDATGVGTNMTEVS